MNFNQKFEPKENRIIHGAGQSLEAFTNYWNTVDIYKPLIYMTYTKIHSIKDWSKKIKYEILKFPNLILQIGLNLRKDHISQCKNIITKEYDKEIELLCKTIKGIKNPVFIRIGYEFNEPNKYNPKEFISSWLYITNKFKEYKINNIATVWCSCPAFSKNIEDIMKFYPKKNVDWWGIDLFGVRHFKDKVMEGILNLSKEYKKPIMIAECSAIRTGTLNGEASWNSWFKPFFELLNTHKTVKALCYINWHWGIDWKQPDWGDCRIQKNKIVKEKYIKELSKSKYIHNMPINKFLSIANNQ